MRIITPAEKNLLVLLRAFVGQESSPDYVDALVKPDKAPDGLHHDAMFLVRQTLSQGCVEFLAREGWRRERFLSSDPKTSGQVREGRLWERTSPELRRLHLTENVLQFACWLLRSDFRTIDAKKRPSPWEPLPKKPLSQGDQFLLFLAYRFLRGSLPLRKRLAECSFFRQHGLCRLTYPEDFVPEISPGKPTPALDKILPPVDYSPWMQGFGAVAMEALQRNLSRHWRETERYKSQFVSEARMRGYGAAQQTAVEPFLKACEKHQRRDLSGFLLRTAEERLRNEDSSRSSLAKLDVKKLRLADRAEVYRAALILPLQLKTLAGWSRQARGVAFYDCHYAASQAWKALWDDLQGDVLYQRAKNLLQHFDLLQGSQS